MATARDRGWGMPPLTGMVRVPCAGELPLRLHPAVAPLFAELIRRVEKIKGQGFMTCSGGYNHRAVRGYELKLSATGDARYLSNHSWGLAADFRAGSNPQAKNGPTDMPGNMAELCRELSLVWGGTWAGARRDPMHVEFVGTPAEAAAAVARLNHHEEDELTEDERALLRRVEGKLNVMLYQMGYDANADTWGTFEVWDGTRRKITLLDMVREVHRELNQRLTGRDTVNPTKDTVLGHVLNAARDTAKLVRKAGA